jgi:alanine-glyoxylate transaminase/serine-glyoxylate transaminase/serine-pyruvate transaminase
MSERPLLMIPGPIEISPAVQAAADGPPPAHTSPALIRAFGDGLRAMLSVWKAGPGAFPYVVAGSGTLAMDMAVANLLDPGDAAVVIDTGYFSDRMARMLERRGVAVRRVGGVPGEAPSADEIATCLAAGPVDAVFVTHVDTSTGVRTDVAAIAAQVRPTGALLVVDGVCATGGEALDMGALGVDVYLTASQKALGLAPGLALLVASARAEEARARRRVPVPMFLDWAEWKPILTAYLEGRPSYFATPATSLVRALPVALGEIGDVDAAVARHARAADAMRRAWAALGLSLVPARPEITANTLSALWLPEGADATLPAKIAAHGVLVAGGLHPAIRTRYFRVGHMGYSTTRRDHLERCVRAVARGLADAGVGVDEAAAVAALG